MPYEGPGNRHDAVCTKKVAHGALCVENKVVGRAFKNTQWKTFDDPLGAEIRNVQVGETFTIMVGGEAETPRTGTLAGANVGDIVYIKEADNALALVNTGATATWYPVGTVDYIDTSRATSYLRLMLVGPASSVLGKVNP